MGHEKIHFGDTSKSYMRKCASKANLLNQDCTRIGPSSRLENIRLHRRNSLNPLQGGMVLLYLLVIHGKAVLSVLKLRAYYYTKYVC